MFFSTKHMEAQEFIRQQQFCFSLLHFWGQFFGCPCCWMLPFQVFMRPWVHIQEYSSSYVMVKNTLGQSDLRIHSSSASLEEIGVWLASGLSLMKQTYFGAGLPLPRSQPQDLSILWSLISLEWIVVWLSFLHVYRQWNKQVEHISFEQACPWHADCWADLNIFLKRLASDFHFFCVDKQWNKQVESITFERACSWYTLIYLRQALLKQTSREYCLESSLSCTNMLGSCKKWQGSWKIRLFLMLF